MWKSILDFHTEMAAELLHLGYSIDVSARDIFIKHDKLVRHQIENYGGKELQNLGDGFMLSFESASSAIKCASDIQRERSNSLQKLSIRIGVNTGEVIRREGEHPFGQAVVIASRILSKCKGRQILVSFPFQTFLFQNYRFHEFSFVWFREKSQ